MRKLVFICAVFLFIKPSYSNVNNDSIKVNKHYLYFSLTGIYVDIRSTFNYDMLWLPLGYTLIKQNNSYDICLGYAIPVKQDLYGIKNPITSIFGVKLKTEFKHLFDKDKYFGMAILFFNNVNKTDLKIKDKNDYEEVRFMRNKVMIVPKIGILSMKKFFFDMSAGLSINKSKINIIKHSLPLSNYDDIQGSIYNTDRDKIYFMFYFEMNLGIKI